MKKIPTLFERDFEGNHQVTNTVVDGCQWVIEGEGVATEKFHGITAWWDGHVLYKRFDAKDGKTPPDGFIPAQEPDPITGHYPGWLPVTDAPEDKYFREGLLNTPTDQPVLEPGTYELVGKKQQGNPYGLDHHELWRHGSVVLEGVPRDFVKLREWLRVHNVEGIVWHHPDGRMAKLKRRDFGFPFPMKGEAHD